MIAVEIALLGALVVPSVLPAQTASPDLAGVDIRVAIAADGRAEVTEHLRLSGDSSTQRGRFRLLTRACADIGSVTIDNDSATAPLRVTTNDPWQELDDSARIAQASADVTLRYVVLRRTGGRDIPLVVPAHPVVVPAGAGAKRVTVRVTTPGSSDRVTFPRMERVGSTAEWRADFVAVPSFVSVRPADADDAPCATPPPAGDDGGLSWRFWLLVAILVVWVPTYQWWARRQPERDGEP